MTFAELLVFHADLERERQRLYDLCDRAPTRMRERLETAAESIVEMQRMLRTDIGQAALDEVLPPEPTALAWTREEPVEMPVRIRTTGASTSLDDYVGD